MTLGSVPGLVWLMAGSVVVWGLCAYWLGERSASRFDTEWRGQLHQMLSPDYTRPSPSDVGSGPSAEP